LSCFHHNPFDFIVHLVEAIIQFSVLRIRNHSHDHKMSFGELASNTKNLFESFDDLNRVTSSKNQMINIELYFFDRFYSFWIINLTLKLVRKPQIKSFRFIWVNLCGLFFKFQGIFWTYLN
jgi:hypothetical protein